MLWYLHIPEGASISRLVVRQLSGDWLWSPRLLLLVAIKNVVKVSVLRDLPLLILKLILVNIIHLLLTVTSLSRIDTLKTVVVAESLL